MVRHAGLFSFPFSHAIVDYIMDYDVMIVGASFSGLTLAHHLPKNLKVLVIDAKPSAGSTVESTGLITTKTRAEFASFFDIDRYITNPITAIGVVAPSYDDYFISRTAEPWIFQTDTKGLVRALAETVPPNVTVSMGTVLTGVERDETVSTVIMQKAGASQKISTRFLVGADGSHSKVAQLIPELDRNKRFLFGYEQVFFGDVHLGTCPEETIYHFWFGEFSLGYGGWLSPTHLDGKTAFRIGLAKLMEDRGEAKRLMNQFLKMLLDRKIITIEGDPQKPWYVFGSLIPIGGVLKRIHHKNTLLIGDAAGFCGAFAADGIKGSVISGKEAAKLIENYLAGDLEATVQLKNKINQHGYLLEYYSRQVRYRQLWDLMRTNRTFTALYRIIADERDTFLQQFCDSKDKRTSLIRTVLKIKHLPKLMRYGVSILRDLLRS